MAGKITITERAADRIMDEDCDRSSVRLRQDTMGLKNFQLELFGSESAHRAEKKRHSDDYELYNGVDAPRESSSS
jgi:hypothetical protein